MANFVNSRVLQYKKTTITVHFTQEVDENGVVQTTACANFLKKSPGICSPLTITVTWNSQEAALQKLIHKIHDLITDGTLIYEEHRFDPTSASIYKAEGVKNSGGGQPPPPPVKDTHLADANLDKCVQDFEEDLSSPKTPPQPPDLALEHIGDIMASTKGIPARGVLESIIGEAVTGILTNREDGPMPPFWKLLLPIQDYIQDAKTKKFDPPPEGADQSAHPQGAPSRIRKVIDPPLHDPAAILDHIIHDAAQALLKVDYYDPAAILDHIIHDAARALLKVDYYDPKMTKKVKAVITQRERKPK